MRISREGFEHVIRCGECPGCAEFDRRRLADRLRAKYGQQDPGLTRKATDARGGRRRGLPVPSESYFIVRIYAPLEAHTRIAHGLHRRRGVELEPGFFRLGVSSFGVIAREVEQLKHILRRLNLEFQITPVRRPEHRRGWRRLTAGLSVVREVYGEQVKRWYARGLPPAEREAWDVDKHAMQKPWRRQSGARARTSGRLVLVPSELWGLSRADRRSFRRELSAATSPEGVSRVMGLVAGALAGMKLTPMLTASPISPADAARRQAASVGVLTRMSQRQQPPMPGPDLPPPSEGGGYVSSEHTGGAGPPAESPYEAFQRGKAERLERDRSKDKELFERFARLGEKYGRKE